MKIFVFFCYTVLELIEISAVLPSTTPMPRPQNAARQALRTAEMINLVNDVVQSEDRRSLYRNTGYDRPYLPYKHQGKRRTEKLTSLKQINPWFANMFNVLQSTEEETDADYYKRLADTVRYHVIDNPEVLEEYEKNLKEKKKKKDIRRPSYETEVSSDDDSDVSLPKMGIKVKEDRFPYNKRRYVVELQLSNSGAETLETNNNPKELLEEQLPPISLDVVQEESETTFRPSFPDDDDNKLIPEDFDLNVQEKENNEPIREDERHHSDSPKIEKSNELEGKQSEELKSQGPLQEVDEEKAHTNENYDTKKEKRNEDDDYNKEKTTNHKDGGRLIDYDWKKDSNQEDSESPKDQDNVNDREEKNKQWEKNVDPDKGSEEPRKQEIFPSVNDWNKDKVWQEEGVFIPDKNIIKITSKEKGIGRKNEWNSRDQKKNNRDSKKYNNYGGDKSDEWDKKRPDSDKQFEDETRIDKKDDEKSKNDNDSNKNDNQQDNTKYDLRNKKDNLNKNYNDRNKKVNDWNKKDGRNKKGGRKGNRKKKNDERNKNNVDRNKKRYRIKNSDNLNKNNDKWHKKGKDKNKRNDYDDRNKTKDWNKTNDEWIRKENEWDKKRSGKNKRDDRTKKNNDWNKKSATRDGNYKKKLPESSNNDLNKVGIDTTKKHKRVRYASNKKKTEDTDEGKKKKINNDYNNYTGDKIEIKRKKHRGGRYNHVPNIAENDKSKKNTSYDSFNGRRGTSDTTPSLVEIVRSLLGVRG